MSKKPHTHKRNQGFVPSNAHEKKIKPYMDMLKPGEHVEMDVEFSVVPYMFYYLGIAAAALIIQRFVTQPIALVILSLVCMFMSFEAARVLIYVQNSAVLITTNRIIGLSGATKCEVDLTKVNRLKQGSELLVDGGPYNFVKLRYLKNPRAVVCLLRDLTEKD